MQPVLLVMAGGALGAGARYGVGRAAGRLLGPDAPWGTLAVNLAGGLAMGLLAGLAARAPAAESWRLFLGVGVLGGFTTFSAFSLELVLMVQRGQALAALGYALASVVGAALLLWAGLLAARALG